MSVTRGDIRRMGARIYEEGSKASRCECGTPREPEDEICPSPRCKIIYACARWASLSNDLVNRARARLDNQP